MKKIFSLDGPLFLILSKIANLVILNLCWIISCLPIITIGAATTGMYVTAKEIVEDKEFSIVKCFFTAFARYFVKATICWLIMLLSGAVLVADFIIIWISKLEGIAFYAPIAFIVIAMYIYLSMLVYLFPLIVRFEKGIKRTFKLALLFGLGHLPYTLLQLAFIIVPIVLTAVNTSITMNILPVWAIMGFAMIACVNEYVISKVFAKYNK